MAEVKVTFNGQANMIDYNPGLFDTPLGPYHHPIDGYIYHLFGGSKGSDRLLRHEGEWINESYDTVEFDFRDCCIFTRHYQYLSKEKRQKEINLLNVAAELNIKCNQWGRYDFVENFMQENSSTIPGICIIVHWSFETPEEDGQLFTSAEYTLRELGFESTKKDYWEKDGVLISLAPAGVRIHDEFSIEINAYFEVLRLAAHLAGHEIV